VNETSKTRRLWGEFERSILSGSGIDIGCGPDPVSPTARAFDVADGDANRITQYVHEQFDYVYSSHCLEHMHDPRAALLEWWQLVRPGGHLVFIVPDEDLYEQGVFPSRFNPDHKATFTIAKDRSWSPVSIDVGELARSLPGGEVVSVARQDQGYDRRAMRHGADEKVNPFLRLLFRAYSGLRRRGFPRLGSFERWQAKRVAYDQTIAPDVVAQIQCIVRKAPKET
jgi:SAM-dependent methyltransferase